MKIPPIASVGILFTGIIISSVTAELPTFNDGKLIGYFQGVENKHVRFGVAADGAIKFKLIGKKGDPIGERLTIDALILIEEGTLNGTTVAKKLIPESLESAQPKSEKPKDVIIRGKVTGDAEFELVVNEDRGVIQLGGRLLNPGKLKNPRFAILLRFPNSYPEDQSAGDRKKEKAFEAKTKDDRVQLTLLDGKKVKPSSSDAVDASAAEFNGTGIAKAQIQFSSYQDNRIELEATANSSFRMENTRPRPLWEGFSLKWTADLAKDPDGKSRLCFEAK